MNYKFSALIIIVLVFLFAFKEGSNSLGKNKYQDTKLRFDIFTTKQFFILGESLPLRFKLTNISNETMLLHDCVNPSNGKLKIFISKDGNKYRQYKNFRWSRADVITKPKPLSFGQSIESSTEILWNYIPNVVNKKELANDQLISDYVFTSRGNYFIKARCQTDYQIGNSTIESAPIQITILEPQGEDKLIWDRIKNNKDFAYFIQEGDIFTPPWEQEKRAKFQMELNDIVNRHPNSFITGQLRKGIEEFNKKEAKRREYNERVNQPNRPQ
jgi:hypothetical protein